MRALKAVARFGLATFLVFGGFYFVVGVAVALLLATGRIEAGQPMYVDLEAPTLGGVVMLDLVLGAALAAAWWLRQRLRPRPALTQ